MKEIRVAFMLYNIRTNKVSLEIYKGTDLYEIISNARKFCETHSLDILAMATLTNL